MLATLPALLLIESASMEQVAIAQLILIATQELVVLIICALQTLFAHLTLSLVILDLTAAQVLALEESASPIAMLPNLLDLMMMLALVLKTPSVLQTTASTANANPLV